MGLDIYAVSSIALFLAIVLIAYVYRKKSAASSEEIKGGDKLPDEKYNQDGSISQQWIAEEIARKEGKADETDIAQIKEILKITLDLLSDIKQSEPEKFDELLAKH